MAGEYRYWIGGRRKPEEDQFFLEALSGDQWQQGTESDWDACWYIGMPPRHFFERADCQHRINHIPGNGSLTVKSRLAETIGAMRKRLERRYGPEDDRVRRTDFVPQVYAMPRDYHALQQAALENPEQRWILKPKNAARGKDIRVVDDVASVPSGERWLVQAYRDRPHLFHGRKYVLRLYVLIAELDPLRVYLYDHGFAKPASEPYDLEDTGNLYSHLTNPDISATHKEAPVEFVELSDYRQWLRQNGHDDDALMARIRDLVALTGIAAASPMRERTQTMGVDSSGCYELLGLDCLVDETLQPWLLECNLSPSMSVCAGPDSGGPVEASVKRSLVADLTALVGLEGQPHASESPAQSGGFQRLIPSADADYLSFFEMPSRADWLAARALGAPAAPPRVQALNAVELVIDDGVGLYDVETGNFIRLNETGSLTWLLAMEGGMPETIASDVWQSAVSASEGGAPSLEQVREDVWATLVEWAQLGLVMQAPETGPVRLQASSAVERETRGTPWTHTLTCGQQRFECHLESAPLQARLAPMLERCVDDPSLDVRHQVEIVRETAGFGLICDGIAVASALTLSSVAPALVNLLAREAARDFDAVIDGRLLASDTDTDPLLLIPADGTSEPAGHGVRGLGFNVAESAFQPLHLPDMNGTRGAGLSGPTAINRVGLDTGNTGASTVGISPGEALAHLIPRTGGRHGRPLTPGAITALADWLGRCELLAGHAQAPEAASPIINEAKETTV